MSDEIKARMPKKPVFIAGFYEPGLANEHRVEIPCIITEKQFNDWYDREIVPLFENAKVVYSPQANNEWNWSDPKESWLKNNPAKYTALLIGIKPIDQAVTKDEIIKTFKNIKLMGQIEIACFIDRIENFGIKP